MQVQPFFLLIMAYIGGGSALLSEFSTENLYKVLVFVAAGFLSIIVHELGHALMMKRYGRLPQIVLHGMGGVAISTGTPFTKKQNLLVTIMGPAAQIALGLIALLIYRSIDKFPTEQSAHFVFSLCSVSLFWAVLNLIPIFPLDGGQILGTLLGDKRRKGVHIFSIVLAGGIIALLLINGQTPLFALLILGLLIFDNVKALQN